jgi:hypothetical protein
MPKFTTLNFFFYDFAVDSRRLHASRGLEFYGFCQIQRFMLISNILITMSSQQHIHKHLVLVLRHTDLLPLAGLV